MPIINNYIRETGVTTTRRAASLAAAGSSCWGCDHCLHHRSHTALVPICDMEEFVGSRALSALGYPAACPPGTAQCQLPHASSRGGSGKSGHSRDGLQLCHLQKSLRESDPQGQWQASKALGVLEALIPPGLRRTRRTLLADGASSVACGVSPAPIYICRPRCLCSWDIVLLEYSYL